MEWTEVGVKSKKKVGFGLVNSLLDKIEIDTRYDYGLESALRLTFPLVAFSFSVARISLPGVPAAVRSSKGYVFPTVGFSILPFLLVVRKATIIEN